MRWWNRWLHWRRRHQLEQDLAEDLRIHQEMIEDELLGQGRSADEARWEARRRVGNVASTLEQGRAAWNWVWLDSLAQDLRYAWRGLSSSKLFTATAVLTLGVGLGLNTLLFTVFNAYVLRPFAVKDSGELHMLRRTAPSGGSWEFSLREFGDLRRRSDVLSDVAALTYTNVPGTPRYSVLIVSGNYFEMLGRPAQLGRTFTDDLAGPDSDPYLVLSHTAWVTKFGQDPNIVGHKVMLHGAPFEVIGVMPEDYAGTESAAPDFWAPFTMTHRLLGSSVDPFTPAQPRPFRLLVRLRGSVDPVRAEEAITPYVQSASGGIYEDPRSVRAKLEARSSPVALSPQLLILFAPVFVSFGLVLVAACANVANMLLARMTKRQREIGVRLSLGASRGRMVRQLLVESLLIALLAGVAGMAVSQLGLVFGERLVLATLGPEFAPLVRLHSLEADYRVVGFVLAAAVAVTILFGLLPALQASRLNLTQALRGEFGSTWRPSRLRNAMVINQVTVCTVLLILSGVLYRNTINFRARETGIRVQDVMEVEVRQAKTREEIARQFPAAAVVARPPLHSPAFETMVTPAGAPAAMPVRFNYTSPEYFDVLGIPIVKGRRFTRQEAEAGAAVAVVSQATARKFWPEGEALGKTIRFQRVQRPFIGNVDDFAEAIVVGVAKDVISGWTWEGDDPTLLYLPINAASRHARVLLVRSSPEALRRAIETGWPEVPVQIVPLREWLAIQTYPLMMASWVGTLLGVIALLLTVSGMYGVMAYLVSQRQKEIGIRIALGAPAAEMLRMVLRQSLRLTALGLGLGLVMALGAAHLLVANVQMNVRAWDPIAYWLGCALVAVAALAAAWPPAWRASRVDPMTTLRMD